MARHRRVRTPATGHPAIMAVLRAFARPMLASIFIVQGYDTLRRPEKVAGRAEKVAGPLKERVDALPDNTEHLVRINGGVQLVAGSLLAIGRFPRLSALALAATLVPTTLAGHPYWEAKDPQERAQQRIHFLKNLTMLGGLLIAAGDTAGNPSLAWQWPARGRLRQARRETGRQERQGPGQNGQGGRQDRKGVGQDQREVAQDQREVGQDRCQDRRGGRCGSRPGCSSMLPAG